jgi:RNA polymerase sigma-70 factor (ECF subfamily)
MSDEMIRPTIATGDRHACAPSGSEAELVHRAHSGDRRAFGDLLRLYERRVFSVVRRMVWREEDAVEITQEVFLQAFKSRHRFEPGRPFRPWLFRIAINLCRNHLRAGARAEEPALLDENIAAMWARSGPDPEHEADARERAQLLGKAMVGLRPQDRALLLLRFREEMDYGELGQVYGAPQTVLKMRVHRALSRLRALMDGALQ